MSSGLVATGCLFINLIANGTVTVMPSVPGSSQVGHLENLTVKLLNRYNTTVKFVISGGDKVTLPSAVIFPPVTPSLTVKGQQGGSVVTIARSPGLLYLCTPECWQTVQIYSIREIELSRYFIVKHAYELWLTVLVVNQVTLTSELTIRAAHRG